MKLIILLLLALSWPLNQLPYDSNIDWITIQNKEVWIGWIQYQQYPWCKVQTIFNTSINNISSIIEDKSHYPEIFKRVESAKIITDEIVYITLKMPFPFSGRDYVVQYKQILEGDDIISMKSRLV